MEQFDHNTHVPKLLPCQHTFCNSCLTSMHKASTAETQITCPVCRSKHTPRRRGFTTNRAVLDIVEEIQTQKPVQTDSVRCAKHNNKECVLICMSCVEGLCVKCIKRGHHQGHRLEEPSKAKSFLQRKYSKERRSFLENQLSVINESPYAVSEITKAESDIKLFQEKLTKEITDWGDEQLSTLQELKREVLKQENELTKELQLLENQNVDLKTMIKFGSSNGSDNPQIFDIHLKGDKHKFKESSQTLLGRIEQAFQSTVSSKIIMQKQITDRKQIVDKSSQVEFGPAWSKSCNKENTGKVERRKAVSDRQELDALNDSDNKQTTFGNPWNDDSWKMLACTFLVGVKLFVMVITAFFVTCVFYTGYSQFLLIVTNVFRT